MLRLMMARMCGDPHRLQVLWCAWRGALQDVWGQGVVVVQHLRGPPQAASALVRVVWWRGALQDVRE